MKIGIVGDCLIDRYWIGETSRISPEAPIPVVKITGKLDLPGGAANVRANLRSLGRDAVVLFKTGNQNYPIKNRLIVENAQIARWDENDWCEPLGRGDLLALVDCGAIIVSDYGKGSITEEVIQVLRETPVPVFVDTKGDPSKWIGNKEDLWMFPNQKEFTQFEREYGWLANVILKQGKNGVSYLQFGRPLAWRPAAIVSPVSVNGAGDTVLAGFVDTYLAGCELGYCLEFAMAAAGVVCQKPYTAVATIDEIQKVFSVYSPGRD